MSSNLKVNTILPSTGNAIGIGTAAGNIDILGHIVGHNTPNISGINSVTANHFYGDISNATGAAAGLGTALSQDQSNPLNKLYYTDRILSIGSTVTIDHPASATGAYTQYADILVEDNADLIVADGDDLIPDILGLGGNGTTGAGGAGRLLVDNIVNRSGTGAPSFPNGAVVTGVVTATSFVGNGANLTNVSPYQFSSWYVTGDYTPTASDVTIKNWAESNADGYERLGTAPTYNNGVFTMPSTGYWRVQASITYYHTTAVGDTFAFALRHSTDSGSSYNHFATIGGRWASSGDGSPANQKFNWVVAGTFKVANASTSRLIVFGVDIRTDGRIMGGSQAGSDSGYCSTLHIEKMANL